MHAYYVVEHPAGCRAQCRCGWASEPFLVAHGWVPGGRAVAWGRAEWAGKRHVGAMYS